MTNEPDSTVTVWVEYPEKMSPGVGLSCCYWCADFDGTLGWRVPKPNDRISDQFSFESKEKDLGDALKDSLGRAGKFIARTRERFTAWQDDATGEQFTIAIQTKIFAGTIGGLEGQQQW